MLWYPYTQIKTMQPPYIVIGAKGVNIYTKDKVLIDSISSWWSVIHGYNHREINEAIKDQIDKFSHVMLGGLTHQPAQKLSQKLSEILPNDLNHTFFSDSGSVAVEVALKMCIQYFSNKGKSKKHRIIALKNSYHGDTFKTMEIGDDEDYHLAFPEKRNVFHINTNIKELQDLLTIEHEKIAAFIVEPLLQGAGGMQMYEIEFLQKARILCDKYDILLIFDEVATGFGRTGHVFVSELVCPDIVVLGKALTAGYIGHAATVASEKVFSGFYSDNSDFALMHGPTFMANPLACCIALKSIEIFYRDNYMSKINNIERLTKDCFRNFSHEKIKEIRIMGACICIEVKRRKDLDGFGQYAYERGIFARPFLNYMYAMVPYIIKDEELYKIYDVFKGWFLKKN